MNRVPFKTTVYNSFKCNKMLCKLDWCEFVFNFSHSNIRKRYSKSSILIATTLRRQTIFSCRYGWQYAVECSTPLFHADFNFKHTAEKYVACSKLTSKVFLS